MLREKGIALFYSGLGPSLTGIVPYIAVNFCIFTCEVTHFIFLVAFWKTPWDITLMTCYFYAIARVKKSLLEKYQKRPQTSLTTALISASLTTLMCYPLDTVRRQMQMKGSPYSNIFYVFPGNIFICMQCLLFIGDAMITSYFCFLLHVHLMSWEVSVSCFLLYAVLAFEGLGPIGVNG